MREVKFRAWDKTNNEWYMNGDPFDLNFSGDNGIFLFDNDCPCNMREVMLEWCQFTGLQDRNGVDIYEGDLIVCERYPFYGLNVNDGELNYVGEVYYWDEGACWYVDLRVISDRAMGRAVGSILSDYQDCKVIGNIYEPH